MTAMLIQYAEAEVFNTYRERVSVIKKESDLELKAIGSNTGVSVTAEIHGHIAGVIQ